MAALPPAGWRSYRTRIIGGTGLLVSFGAFVNIQFNQVLFTERGLTPTQVGLAAAAGNFASLFSPLLAGWWSDRTGSPRLVLTLYMVFGAVGLWLLPSLQGFLLVGAGFFLCQIVLGPVSPLAQALVIARTGASGKSFLVMRAMGTLGFLLVSWFFYRYLDRWELGLGQAYRTMAILLVASMPFFWLLGSGPRTTSQPTLRLREVLGYLWRRKLWPVYLGGGIGYFCNAMGVTVLGILVTGPLGRTKADIAGSWLIAATFEVGFMLLSIPFVRRFGLKTFLIVGLLGTALRWSIAGVAWNFHVFLLTQVLHGMMVAGVFTGQSLYLARLLPKRRIASGAAAAALVNGGVMSVAGSALAGWIWGVVGVRAVCETTAIVALGGAVFFWRFGPSPQGD